MPEWKDLYNDLLDLPDPATSAERQYGRSVVTPDNKYRVVRKSEKRIDNLIKLC